MTNLIIGFSLATSVLCAIYGWGSDDSRRLKFSLAGLMAGLAGMAFCMEFAA